MYVNFVILYVTAVIVPSSFAALPTHDAAIWSQRLHLVASDVMIDCMQEVADLILLGELMRAIGLRQLINMLPIPSPSAALVTTLAAACGAAILYYLRRPQTRIATLIRTSKSHHRSKQYEESFAAALEARSLAAAAVPGSASHIDALVHLAGTLAAQDDSEKAIDVLAETLKLAEAAFGVESIQLVPILHARAECIEQSGPGELARAASELARAREIRRKACGENSMESAFASFNLASVLVKGSQEDGVTAERREMLVERSVALTLEACSIAVAMQQPDEGVNLVDEILMLLDAEEVLASRDDAQMQKLKDAYLEAAGEEWEPLVPAVF